MTGAPCCARTPAPASDDVDIYSVRQRSRLMAKIRSRDTRPELAVRRRLHARGFRFRLHRKDLPGSPDVVLPRFRTAIFVHGCFWHQHPGCRRAALPSTRTRWWRQKLQRNVERDRRAVSCLRAAGWRVHVLWECEIRDDVEGVLDDLCRNLQWENGQEG